MPRDLFEQQQTATQPRDLFAAQQPAATQSPPSSGNRLLDAVRSTKRTGWKAQVADAFANPAQPAQAKSWGELGSNYGDIAGGAATGAIAGIGGIPGDVEGLARSGLSMVSKVSPDPWLHTTEEIGNDIAGPASNSYAQAGRVIGSFAGPAAAIKGARAVGGMARAAMPPKLPPAPTSDELRTASQAAYKTAEDAGVIISKDSWSKFANALKGELANEGIDAGVHPKALSALNRITSVDDNVTLKGADILRRVAGGAAKSIEPDERRLASIIRERLDDYLSSIGEKDVLAGDPSKATQALSEARGLWSRMSKGEMLDDIVEHAKDRAGQFSGSGYENALRTGFRNLAMNDKKMRRFSKAEQDVIKGVGRGGPAENALRMLGKLAPTGVVSGGAGAAIGYGIGGPVGAVALPMAGAGARLGATALTTRNAKNAADFMRRGNSPLPAPLPPVPRNPLLDPLAIGLVEGYGNTAVPLSSRRQPSR